MIFTDQQKKDITRRQLNIAIENAGYNTSVESFNKQKLVLLSVDQANDTFFDFYSTQVKSYEDELTYSVGNIPARYSVGSISPFIPGDVSSSAKFPSNTLFFPTSPIYTFNIPKVVNEVNGALYSTLASRYELNILNNSDLTGLNSAISYMLNGITGATSYQNTTSSAIPAGPVSALVVTVTASTSFTAGELVYINQGTASGIYRITAKTATSITIDSFLPATTAIGTSATVKNTVPGFNALERQNLTSANYQQILNNLATIIDNLVAEWYTVVNDQKSALTAQNDTRATQLAQNQASLADVNNALTIITTWQARPQTGSGNRFTNLGALTSEATDRVFFIGSRNPEIFTALGSVSQSQDTYSGSGSYFERYKWLNIKINRASGGARRYFGADQSVGVLQALAADNNALSSEYSNFFLTQSIILSDDKGVQVKDATGFSAGNIVRITTESQPILTFGIIRVDGNFITLDRPVPKTYLIDDILRIFKELP